MYLKRAVRESVVGNDADNIQMLKCFTLHNAMRGLCLMMKKITSKKFVTSTIVLDSNTGEVIDENKDIFDF